MEKRKEIIGTRILPVQPVLREYFEGDQQELLSAIWSIVNTSCQLNLAIEDFKIEESEMYPIEDLASNPILLRLLQILVLLKKPKKVLEIGTFVGVSAMYMASVLPDESELITVEKYSHFCDIAKRNFLSNGLENKIKIVEGDALEVIKEFQDCSEKFDLIFLDGNKENYLDYFKILDPLLVNEGLFIVDDVLFNGDVLNKQPKTPKGRGVLEFIEYTESDTAYHKILLPIGNGVMLMFKKEVA